jgi:hypothetical protein
MLLWGLLPPPLPLHWRKAGHDHKPFCLAAHFVHSSSIEVAAIAFLRGCHLLSVRNQQARPGRQERTREGTTEAAG